MAHRKTIPAFHELIKAVQIRSPLVIVMGSPREVADMVQHLPGEEATCFQMDLYQAGSLEKELRERGLKAEVRTAPDLWDLPGSFQTVLYPVPERGERSLKIDMIEQAFHTLTPAGRLVVLSPYEKDQFFPIALKKVFKRVHAPAAGEGALFWCPRQGERPRRRHEITYQVQSEFGRSLRFLSRPGVFSYGRFDDGARALVETMEIKPGDRVLDIGCGSGTNGIFAGLRAGRDGFTAFVDSNIRAVALARHNAQSQGLVHFEAIASAGADGLADRDFDVVLANPPYFAQQSIAQMFIDRSRQLLRPDGRIYLVTKQPDQVGPMMAEAFGETQVVERRGYFVLHTE